MSQNDGMVPDEVLERLKNQIEAMKAECVKALDRVSRALPQDIHERLEYAQRANADLMMLCQLVDWQLSLRQAKKQQQESVLQ